ncbi:MAG: hypothetical protein ATN32_01040 [Candidatus Epulonipiscium fishelsonii]|nr:MAG: hypothetical protein ATN32_01040 [Epulopiscium sp. AS2M-Bin002]
MFDLSKKTAVITGSSQGIGYDIAALFAKQGVNVTINSRHFDKALVAANKINELGGGKAIAVSCDVRKSDQLINMFEETKKAFGQIDILINNAGVLHSTAVEDITEEEWQFQIDINLTGTFLACQKAYPYLKESKAGRIINIASVAGRMGSYASGMGYVASKGGARSLSMGLARQYGKDGITVNCICPGVIATSMVEQWSEATLQSQLDRVYTGRLGTTYDIGALCIYLASDESGYMTGATLDINGGMFMG